MTSILPVPSHCIPVHTLNAEQFTNFQLYKNERKRSHGKEQKEKKKSHMSMSWSTLPLPLLDNLSATDMNQTSHFITKMENGKDKIKKKGKRKAWFE